MKTKKIIVAILLFSVTLIISAFTGAVRAESLGNLTITKDRSIGDVVYRHQLYSNNTAETKNVWKLVTCNPDGTITDTINDLYCLRAGLGFTSEGSTNNVVEYNQSKNMMEEYDSLVTYFSTLTSETTIFDEANRDKFNEVMWILDNMLLEDAKDDDVNTYLKNYAGYTDETLNKSEYKENVLSRADIEAIQQLAIWYFTNSDQEAYNKETLPTLNVLISGDEVYDTEGVYKTFADIFNALESYGTERQQRANTLYTTLIAKAIEAQNALGENENYTPTREITIFLAGTNAAVEQPVVRVRDLGEADIALRKFISAINGVKLEGEASREPVVDTSKLNKIIDGKLQTTAIYNHSKEPVRVSLDDNVTYTIRLYNEGDIAIYVKEVKDYLPNYLEYNGSEWALSYPDGRSATTTEYCVVTGASDDLTDKIGESLKDVLIPAAKYNQETDGYTLSYVDIEITCKVVTTAKFDENMTNIAEVTAMTSQNGTSLLKDRDSMCKGGMTLPEDSNLPSYTGGANGKNDPYYDGTNALNDGRYYPGQEDDDDFDKIYVKKPVVDLALRKFIAEVNDTIYHREPNVDTTPLKQGEDTAIYEHSKVPVRVNVGDIVTYIIRIYNEGDIDAKVDEVKDHLAKNLKYIELDEGDNWWTVEEEEKYNTLTSTSDTLICGVGGNTNQMLLGEKIGSDVIPAIIPAYDKTNDVISYIDLKVFCEVLPVEETTKITNIAEITSMTDEYGNPLDEDRDSEPDNVVVPEDLPGYKDDEIDEPYIPGQQDDDDFEKVIVVMPEVDLSLRKFISAVDGEKLEGDNSREPVVKTTVLDNHTDTTAEYEHSKKPLTVKKGSLVTYTIRVYNEGEVNAYVSKITDYLPDYLIYLPENETNIKYDWQYDETTRELTTTIAAEDNTKGDTVFASRENGKLLLKYDETGKLDYIEVEVVCKVDENALGNKILTNLAQITEIKDENGRTIEEDRDSKPDGNFTLPSDGDRPTYKDDESNKPYVPGQEDDDDFEKILVKPDYDLALRKFITRVGTTNINNRYPEVTFVDGKLKYTHAKNPLDVVTGDVIIYTLRIYNEGEADGYANEITDDVPEGLEFLVDNETNIEYRWKMLDENQEETDDVTKAKYIITDYLSEEQAIETGRDNLIKAFDKEAGASETNPDYRDIKIAFKVTYTANTIQEAARIITNEAQISADSDDDIDSYPHRDEVYDYDEDNEDDIDFEKIKVKYFDLSLLKWVAQTKVTLNGKTTVTDTGHTAETSKNEAPVKIEIKEKDINKINIKYIYTIRVTNEGEIEGYVKEITDYIPQGLKFEEADNPDWYIISDGVIGTKALENTLLKPGEYAEVQVVLTWINGKDNFGEKINLAEISQDYNDSETPDIDSTPDNKVPEEDDIDDAPVIITVKTGSEQIYIGLVLIVLATFALGTGLIKKYVLE